MTDDEYKAEGRKQLRDQFAAMVMVHDFLPKARSIEDMSSSELRTYAERAAQWRYAVADAMMKERDK